MVLQEKFLAKTKGVCVCNDIHNHAVGICAFPNKARGTWKIFENAS